MICQKIDQGGQAGNASAYNSVADEKAIHTDRVQCASDQHGCKADTFSHDNLFRLFLHFRKNAPSFPFYFVLKFVSASFLPENRSKNFSSRNRVLPCCIIAEEKKSTSFLRTFSRSDALRKHCNSITNMAKTQTFRVIFCPVSFRLYIKTTVWKGISCKRKEKCNYPTSKERKSKKRNPIV